MSKLLDKMNTYACTQSIEDGCLALGQRAEYRTDKDLYHVIRLQKIIENIETLARSTGSEAEAEEAYVRVRAQLEEFRAFLSVEVSDSRESKFPYLGLLIDRCRPPFHAIPHCKTVSLPGRLLRTQFTAITCNASKYSY